MAKVMMEKNGFPYSRFHLNQIRGVAAEKNVVFSIILSAAIDMLDRDHGQMGTALTQLHVYSTILMSTDTMKVLAK